MAQHGFPIGGGHGGSINPNELGMMNNFGQSYQNNFSGHNNNSNAYATGSAILGDDELLDGLSPTEPQGMSGQAFGDMGSMGMRYAQQAMFSSQHHGIHMDQSHGNGFSSTPDGDPMASPYAQNGFGGYRPTTHPGLSGMQYAGSPLASEMNDGESSFIKARARMPQAMQRKPSNTQSPLTPKAQMAGLSMNSESGVFASQPIRTNAGHHEKSQSGQWIQTPNSISSFPGSGFSSPLQPGLHTAQINDVLLKGGASMPTKLNAQGLTQEAKRRKRRESHNLVERRRRDNINERIQDLSKLVPAHRLEDEKIRKAIQNGTPLSPTLAGIGSPSQATSALAGPGARRATGGTAGNITTGLPLDEKDKGPNKGDILNGAVSWARDLMWMCHLKMQQQEELFNYIVELGGNVPFEITDDERRMQTELMEALSTHDENTREMSTFSYSRTAGSGLRVPHHTDYKGEPLNSNGLPADHISISPDAGEGVLGADLLDAGDFLEYDDDGSGDLDFKEEDEYAMDLAQ
jgi:hypothetical protein